MRSNRIRGFTYLTLLFVIAIVSVGLASVGEMWSRRVERERAVQAEWVAKKVARARQSYYDASPGTVKQWPASTAELLEDRRFLGMRRHLREDYPKAQQSAAVQPRQDGR
jgi:type II secretory pathway pseudopilin PulG